MTARLGELLDVAPSQVHQRQDRQAPAADAVIEIAGTTFVVEYKSSGSTAPVSAAIEQVRRLASSAGPHAIPLVVVPFMGPVGRRRCEDAEVAWLDLSGNARIVAPGIRVLVEGQPNRFKSRGRPSSAFAPKSSRISRWLLMHAGHLMKQRDLAQATVMDEGFTSRIVSRLEEENFVLRGQDGEIMLRDPDLLLDAWRETYDFSMHQVIQGHLTARSGEEALRLLADGLQGQGVRSAATGLAAAWVMTRFAGFRLTTMYVAERPASEMLETLGFREEERGANVWLVVPKDEGVFQGAAERDGIPCVHPVQVYLDLKDHPERAKEAAEQLRSELLRWGSRA
ncbi:MAG: type IV toxin-antitoxin system AbiEi family antitoxin [Candidatus Krumholzibacteriia bacterium]